MELKDLEKEIENIKIRNARVELDKKWETCCGSGSLSVDRNKQWIAGIQLRIVDHLL